MNEDLQINHQKNQPEVLTDSAAEYKELVAARISVIKEAIVKIMTTDTLPYIVSQEKVSINTNTDNPVAGLSIEKIRDIVVEARKNNTLSDAEIEALYGTYN